jgi:hypothetical protein
MFFEEFDESNASPKAQLGVSQHEYIGILKSVLRMRKMAGDQDGSNRGSELVQKVQGVCLINEGVCCDNPMQQSRYVSNSQK